jgi:hypothetical protein
LVIEQMLKDEAGAGEIEQNLVKARLLIGRAAGSVGWSDTFRAEALGEREADQFSRRDASLSRGPLDALEQLWRETYGVWNLRHWTVPDFSLQALLTSMNPGT